MENVLISIPILMDTWALTFMGSRALGVKVNKLHYFILVLLYSPLFVLKIYNEFSSVPNLQTMVSLLAIILIVTNYKIAYKQTVFNSIILFIMYSLLTVPLGFMTILLEQPLLKYNPIIKMVVMHTFTGLSIIALSSIGVRSIFLNIEKVKNLVTESPLTKMLFAMSVSFLIVPVLLINEGLARDDVTGPLLAISIILVLGTYVMVIKLTNRMISDRIRLNSLDTQEVYIDNSKQVLNDIREFWHNYANISYGINLILQEDLTKEQILSVLADLARWGEEKQIKEKVHVLSITNPIIRGIISEKVSMAGKRGVNIDVNAQGDVGKLDVNIIELLQAIGIIMDNVIEFSSCAEQKSVTLDIEKTDRYDLVLKVSNYFTKENGVNKKIEKSNKVGLSYIEKLTRENKNIEFYTEEDNLSRDTYMFISTLKVKKVGV